MGFYGCLADSDVPNVSRVDAAISETCYGPQCTFTLSFSFAVALIGALLFSWATLLIILGPFMIAYSISGRILFTQPLLIGVQGAVKIEEASHYLYRARLSRARIVCMTSGSALACHAGDGDMQQGQNIYDEVKTMDDVCSLVDTSTGTLYYFTAKRPPTVCLYTGQESGSGRFVLCSEKCTADELVKETMLRMPSGIHSSMRPCGWLANKDMEE